MDFVRGSITCKDENEVVGVFEQACKLSIQHDGIEVVRIKNSFQQPVSGGYADLKLFVLVVFEEESTGLKTHHICELQVHLESFLRTKQYSHLPYAVSRGDFAGGGAAQSSKK